MVGGAALAANHGDRERLTEDVDALTRDQVVMEEARALARERGLPVSWLNSNASMWMPPLPAGVLDPPATPGLRVTFADDGFLFANKLLAQRAKDVDDVVALADRLGLTHATPPQLENHIRDYYTDPAMLEFIVEATTSTWRFAYSPRTQRGSCGAAPQAAALNRAARRDPRTPVAPVSPSSSARTSQARFLVRASAHPPPKD